MPGLGVAVVTAAISVGSIALHEHLSLGVTAANLVLHMVMLSMIAGIVSSFRYSFDRERHFARRDRMTGALNKPAFDQEAETMLSAAAAEGRPLLLAFLDLDGFKLVNDRYGHAAGDSVLRQFGAEA